MRATLLAAAPLAMLALGVQSCVSPPASMGGVVAEAPYERDGKLPMVQVRVDGRGPFWFIVDSGASRTVLDARLAEELGLETTSVGSTTGTGQGAVPLRFVGKVNIGLDDLTYTPEPYVIDLSGAPLDKRVRGLVGSEIFNNYIVRLDPDRQRLTVYEPEAPPMLAAGASLPLRVDGGKLFLPAELEVRPGRVLSRQLRIDTGSESSVNDPSAAEAALISATKLGGGLGANFEGVSGKFESVSLGPYRIAGVWGPGGTPPAIGMELLQRFTVTFDAPHGRIHLAPNERFADATPHPPGEVRSSE